MSSRFYYVKILWRHEAISAVSLDKCKILGNATKTRMDCWLEFLTSSWGEDFVADGFGGIAGVVSGYPLHTLRIRQQQSCNFSSALNILCGVVGRKCLPHSLEA